MEPADPTPLPAGVVSTTTSFELTRGWRLTSTPPRAAASPSDLPPDTTWRDAVVPGTVARAVGAPDLDSHADYDAEDWWYRCELPPRAFEPGPRHALRFDGLATLAEVWLNGHRLLESNDMFLAHEVEVTGLVGDRNELLIAFRSLGAALSDRRPRPRWRTDLVDAQQLRWFRTTLLGRIPGWSPRIAPVGPWRSIWAETVTCVDVRSLRMRSSVEEGAGLLDFSATLVPVTEDVRIGAARLRVGDTGFELEVDADGSSWTARGRPRLERPGLWWPKTHGEPTLYACRLEVDTSAGPVSVDCGRVGFRKVDLDRSGGRVQLLVNGVPVFCRGSCWTSNDIVSLTGDPDRMRSTLELLAAAHGNMVRVGGTMVYETDAFYRACDELGLMVWQDFMFANMDYPADDGDFTATVRREAEQQLRRLSRHPSVVTYCGGSEVEQQAAMLGAPRDLWSNSWFSNVLPSLVETHAPGTPYWPSTPTGGTLPFHVGEGLAHYYGVGAYRRPLDDARLARVKFTPECLGFSHVPEPANLQKLTPAGAVPPHHPAWKRGVPRDSGAGWDFEDVRDHYLESLYGVQPVRLRTEDVERYLELSRIVTGEVMEHVFAEWRRPEDPCAGALTWFLSDLRPGAGWGLIDSDGAPKPVYHHLRRAWAPRSVHLLDRGLDGLVALVVNDHGALLEARLELSAVARGSTVASEAERLVVVPPRSAVEVPVEAALGHFVDPTYSYRFGPPRHEAIVARLLPTGNDTLLSEAVHRPVRSAMTPAPAPSTSVDVDPGGELVVTLRTEYILYDVRIDVRDHRPLDNHFCLTPGRPRTVRLTRLRDSGRSFQGYVEALNLRDPVRLAGPG